MIYQSTNCVGIQVLLNYNAYNSDKSSADVSVRLSVRIDCLASYFLLALCQRKFIIRLPRRQHKQTQQNKRHFNWALTTLAIWSVQVQVCACVCLGICGYLCQTVQGALVHFHWNTRNMSSQLPQLFPLYLCKYVNCIGMCVCVWEGRGSSWIFCCALQNNNLKCAMRFVVVMSVRSDDNKPSPIGVFHTSPGQVPV